MKQKSSVLNKVGSIIKAHPVFMMLAALGAVVLSLGNFLGAVDKIRSAYVWVVQAKDGEKKSANITADPRTSFAINAVNRFLEVNNIDVKKIEYFDFARKGKDNEFYVTYWIDGFHYLDIFTTARGGVENLYHAKGDGEDIGGIIATLKDKTYFIVSRVGGSRAIMRFDILDYDGITKPLVVFDSAKIANHVSMQAASIHVIDKSIYLRSNTQRFELVFQNNKFTLNPYTKRIGYNSNIGTNLLAFVATGKDMVIVYNGMPLEFQLKAERSFESIKPLRLGLRDQILIDDNVDINKLAPRWQNHRILIYRPYLSTPEGSRGFFSSVVAVSKGTTKLSIIDGEDNWFDVNIEIN